MESQNKINVHALAEANIQSRILTLRGVQVMLDRDLAELYGVTTSVFNQAVKRNIDRFPPNFRFQLTKQEHQFLMSQIVISKKQSGAETRGGHHKLPFAFTEQGIAMLSGVLRSDVAIRISIRIMETFVAMRKALASLAPILSRIEATEQRQIEERSKRVSDQSRNEERFKLIFDAMRDKEFPTQKVFYDGEVFDADVFVTQHILKARSSILLIDSWVDVVTLEILSKKHKSVAVEIVTTNRGNKISQSDIEKFNVQYGGLSVRESASFHDRFLIVDNKELYLFGASLKDLGKKCFAFTKLSGTEIPGLKARI